MSTILFRRKDHEFYSAPGSFKKKKKNHNYINFHDSQKEGLGSETLEMGL